MAIANFALILLEQGIQHLSVPVVVRTSGAKTVNWELSPTLPESKKRTRRHSPLGTRVLVCGKTVSGRHNLVCLLPPSIEHTLHTALAVDEENHLVIGMRREGEETEWLNLTDPTPDPE